MDETTNASNTEQVVIYLRWVDGGLEVLEEFAAPYQIPNSEASTLFSVARDILSRLTYNSVT